MKSAEKVICMAMDAFRLCVGIQTRNFSKSEVAAYVAQRLENDQARGDGQ